MNEKSFSINNVYPYTYLYNEDIINLLEIYNIES